MKYIRRQKLRTFLTFMCITLSAFILTTICCYGSSLYTTLYNEAFTAIDCTNGLGDVPQFALIEKGYKNLYYDDPQLKKYTATFSQPAFNGNKDGISACSIDRCSLPTRVAVAKGIRRTPATRA